MRCKFKVYHVVEQDRSVYDPLTHAIDKRESTFSVFLSPVMNDGTPENMKFFEATPAGQIELNGITAAAAAGMVEGAEFYVDFTLIPSSGQPGKA